MIEVINSLSDELVLRLAAANWPELHTLIDGSTGRIIIANEHTLDQYMPPRVSFIPQKSTFAAPDPTRGPVPVASNISGYDAESKAAIANRAIATELVNFRVACWGIASDGEDDPYGADFEYTRAIYHALLASAQALMPTCYTVEPGVWQPVVVHAGRVGREFIFGMTIAMPVLATLAERTGTPGLGFAPSDVAMSATDSMVIGTGESSSGCEGADRVGEAEPTLGDATIVGTGTVT
jgi:hypothetical protein